jgi:lipoyl(octanoyl) transferase
MATSFPLPAICWRTLISPPLPGTENMATDEALMVRAGETNEAVFRVYSWSAPTLSLGRNQLAIGAFDPAHAEALGIRIVRRITGGRALLHHREVTYSVTLPAGIDAPGILYDAINEILLGALRSLGVDANVVRSADRLPPPASAPCFERPADGEIALRGRKLVGSAQLREGDAVLQHGSILVHDDQALVARLAVRTIGSVERAGTLFEELGREPSTEEVARALIDSLELEVGAKPTRLDPNEIADAVRERRTRYASDEWTWRQ